MKAGIGFDTEVPSGLKKMMAVQDSRKEELGSKINLVERLKAALDETEQVSSQLMVQHDSGNHPKRDECTEALKRLETNKWKLVEAFQKNYSEVGKLAVLVYGR